MQHDIGRWSGRMFRANQVSASLDRFLTALAEHLDESGIAVVQRQTLAEEAGQSYSTCQRNEREASKRGWLKVTRASASHKGNHASRYEFLAVIPSGHVSHPEEDPESLVVIPSGHAPYKDIHSTYAHSTRKNTKTTTNGPYREVTLVTNNGAQDRERDQSAFRYPQRQAAAERDARWQAAHEKAAARNAKYRERGLLVSPPAKPEPVAKTPKPEPVETLSPQEWAAFERSLRAGRTNVVDETPRPKRTLTIDEIRKAA